MSNRSPGRPTAPASRSWPSSASTPSTPRRSRSSTSRPARARSWPARTATTRARGSCPTARSSTSSDADGWFQVVRRSADGRDRLVLTDGEREHGEPSGGYGYAPLPSPDGSRVVHIEVHDGLIDLVVRDRGRWSAAETRPGTAAEDAADRRSTTAAERISPWDGTWRADRLDAGRRVGRGHRGERDPPAGPVAAARPGSSRRMASGRARSPTAGRRCSPRPWPRAASPRASAWS